MPAEQAKQSGYAGLDGLPPDYAYAPPPPRHPDGRPYFIGTAEQVAADLESLAAAGAEHFVLRFWAGDPSAGIEDSLDQMNRFAEQVRPHLEKP